MQNYSCFSSSLVNRLFFHTAELRNDQKIMTEKIDQNIQVLHSARLVSTHSAVRFSSHYAQMHPHSANEANLPPLSRQAGSVRDSYCLSFKSDPSYANFHDEEWGIPVHDDKRSFELLVLCGALAELTWPSILSKRHIFREVFTDFDPIAVVKLNEKFCLCQIIDDFGSFDKYILELYEPQAYRWQIPISSSSCGKDLKNRRDHCFRFQDCVAAAEGKQKDLNEAIEAEICRSTDDLSFSLV
nr:uncharacterized protein LOC104087655 [Nicotiana tomentosiformis]